MMPHATVYTTGRSLRHQQGALKAAPAELRITMLDNPTREKLLAGLREAEYWISERVGVIDGAMLEAATQLKLILRLGAMTHDIDVEAARQRGVIVCRWPDTGTIAVAEHTMMQILALSKKLREVQTIALEAVPRWGESRTTDANTFAYNWSGRQHIKSLWMQTVGIVGFGEIGIELARRLKGWGCTLLYHKRVRLPEAVEAELGLTYADTDRLRQESDVLINLLPYTPETIGLINGNWLAATKQGVLVVSCGSGGTVDEQALANAVRSGHVSGAAMDSYSSEPVQADNPLVVLAREGANVLLTPHTAAGSNRNRSVEYTNILRHLRGEAVLNRVV